MQFTLKFLKYTSQNYTLQAIIRVAQKKDIATTILIKFISTEAKQYDATPSNHKRKPSNSSQIQIQG